MCILQLKFLAYLSSEQVAVLAGSGLAGLRLKQVANFNWNTPSIIQIAFLRMLHFCGVFGSALERMLRKKASTRMRWLEVIHIMHRPLSGNAQCLAYLAASVGRNFLPGSQHMIHIAGQTKILAGHFFKKRFHFDR
ncbi:MAG: hypothetical protein AWT59_2979 [Candidatus Gallionella acididurans]|uniref:Uncharacterized protein n=1 Tax=Candidatus Gallionella acididurans TaxID=1796491 RepID=A0A139BPK8_9PROT|nr:MAG: hypothetical protein AWT59_2979 [Candidatus Gallionella acididurans]